MPSKSGLCLRQQSSSVSPTLYLNRWRSQNGAATLLAPGSIVADNYREFRDRISGNFKLTWQTEKPIQDFATETVSVRLTESHTVEADFSENAWLNGSWSQQEGYSEYIVTDAFVKDEALRLLPSSLSGNQNNLTLEILDVAAKSDELITQFLIAYRVSNRLRYEGAIPAELISREGNIFRLDIGKLPIDPEFLEVGTRAEVEITAIRAFNNYQAQQVMTLRRTLRD
ncbi:MAG: hypothetical protein SAJ11_23955 [Jaaginema sp. PMC 1078.18]|nr:hypothetical protein [Jaaginema sp. PMC 1078.18]